VRRTGRLLAALCLAAAMPAAAQTVTGTDWRITALGGAAVPPEAREPVIRLDPGPDAASFTASAGCNRFGGSARIEGEALTFGPARATRMACPPPLDAAEAALSDALTGTVRWELEGGTLRLLDAGGSVLLEAVAAN
jgi:heat shock protein HslJ